MYKKFIIPIIIIICIFVVIRASRENSNDFQDDYSRHIKILNNYPIDIIVYGEDIPFRDNLNIRRIDEISKKLLKSSIKKQILILSDLDDSMSISDEELLIIKDELENNNDFDFYYLGTKELERLKQLGFYKEERPLGDYCLAIVIYEGRREFFTGIWAESDVKATKDNRETMAMLLARQFVRVLKSNE